MTTQHTAFHFSPRPNRAHEIAWREWSDEAFGRAQLEDKPVLLSISAVWCHWCHVMDETSYSDPAVIALIAERFVPVRVDNDRRPDVNARYNQGGWPTTAFLTPDGSLLAGATYLPPDQMRAALEQISTFYAENREKIAERSAQIRKQSRAYESAPPESLDESIVHRVYAAVEELYDAEYGGFGDAPKFPMVDVLDFLWQEHRVTGSQHAYEMLAHSLIGMASGGTYDHVEGGFFRYSTTRDWSVPHFEKMTEDHAGLLRVLAGLTKRTRNESFRRTLLSAALYVRAVLRDPQSGLFAGSQDADESYYAMPLDERKAVPAPYVDRTSYSNWTAAMAAAFILAGDALEDERFIAEGCAALDALHERMRDAGGLLYHFIEPGGAPQVRGLLTDQSAYLRALLDAHEYTGEPRFFERAREMAARIQERFGAPDAGFYDHAAIEQELGNLTVRDRPLPDNASLAESFLRLSVLAGDAAYRETAQKTLALYAHTYERAGIFAAAYARAVRRLITPESSAVLTGTPEETSELREAVTHLPAALMAIRTIPPQDEAELQARGYDPALHPAAYICAGTACAPPAHEAADVRSAYESIAR